MNDENQIQERAQEWVEPMTWEQKLAHLETQVKMGTYMTMMALREISVTGIYKELGYDSLESYRRERLPFVTKSHADRLLLVAEQFGTGDAIQNLLGDNDGARLLAELANPGGGTGWDGAMVLLDGQEVPLADVFESKQDEMRKALEDQDVLKSEKLLNEIKQLRRDVRNREKELKKERDLTELTEEELKKTQTALQGLAQGVDPERLVRVTNVEAAKEVCLQAYGEISRHISIVNDIPDDIALEPEILQHISMLDHELENIRHRLMERFGAHMDLGANK